MSLAIEEDFQKFSDEAYNCFEKEGNLTLGLDDMLCSIASKREESIYLLKSTLKKGTEMKSISRMSKAEALQTLVKVAKLQEKLLNKLSMDGGSDHEFGTSEEEIKSKFLELALAAGFNRSVLEKNILPNLTVDIMPGSNQFSYNMKFDTRYEDKKHLALYQKIKDLIESAGAAFGLKKNSGVVSFDKWAPPSAPKKSPLPMV